jgi:hypothetical protein
MNFIRLAALDELQTKLAFIFGIWPILRQKGGETPIESCRFGAIPAGPLPEWEIVAPDNPQRDNAAPDPEVSDE